MPPTPRPPRVILVGAGGYGLQYARQLLEREAAGQASLAAVVDPTGAQRAADHPLADRSDLLAFDRLDEALAADLADAVVIASPIAYHAEHLAAAVGAGLRVLVEKPLCAGSEDIARCRAAASTAAAPIHVGYQLSYTPSMRHLKSRIRAGDLGAPLDFTIAVSWPRDRGYYARNAWAGRLRDRRGAWVLDSPANNACAHFLFNALWLLGESEPAAADADLETAILARAYPIESADTVWLQARCRGVRLTFAATHADPVAHGPVLRYRFEAATVTMPWPGEITITWQGGREERLSAPADDHHSKLDHLLDPALPVCASVEAATSHAELILAAHTEPIRTIAPERIRAEADRISVDGLGATLARAVDRHEPPDLDQITG